VVHTTSRLDPLKKKKIFQAPSASPSLSICQWNAIKDNIPENDKATGWKVPE